MRGFDRLSQCKWICYCGIVVVIHLVSHGVAYLCVLEVECVC